MVGLGNKELRVGQYELDVDPTYHRSYFHLLIFSGYSLGYHGHNFLPMPYPYILRVWIPITHGYKILPSLAHAHYF